MIIHESEQYKHDLPANLSKLDVEDYDGLNIISTYCSIIKKFNNILLTDEGVFYKNGLLEKESLPIKKEYIYYQFKHLLGVLIKKNTVYLDKKKSYLLVFDKWSVGHFHWFCDVLPKLIDIKINTSDFVLLLPDHHYIKTVGLESLERLRLVFSDIVFLKREHVYKIRNLYFITAVAPCGMMSRSLMGQLRLKMVGNIDKGSKRVYISRKNARYRKVKNEHELIPILNAYNIETISIEESSLKEQIEIFSNCDTIMGIHGAGLTNCVFMPEKGNLVEIKIKESALTNGMYWHLSGALNHNYYYSHGRAILSEKIVGQGSDVIISAKDFELNLIKKIVGS